MAPAARDAQLDFVRLSAEEPSSLYFEEFLGDGYSAWPVPYQRRFPGLRTWHGVAGLKDSLRRLSGAPGCGNVLLASRSLALVELAARQMFRACRNILTTDLSWPTYQQAIQRRAARTGNRVTNVPLRERILRDRWTPAEVVEYLAQAYVDNRCDGLCLPAVDHLGIRLPVRGIVEGIQRVVSPRFVLVDAAQAFCQVSIAECFDCADFIVTGSHKWMHAYLPMGIGFIGQRLALELFGARRCRPSPNCDSLLHFTEQITGNCLDNHSETTNLACLFAAAGAADDLLHTETTRVDSADLNFEEELADLPVNWADWRPLVPQAPLTSRIRLFQGSTDPLRSASPTWIRHRWLSAGAIISAYPGGLVRIAMPSALQHYPLLATSGDVDSGHA
jgi:hypothetical protein